MRTSGAPDVGSPSMSATAVSIERSPSNSSRSKAIASNGPHLVGSRVETMRRTVPACMMGLSSPGRFFGAPVVMDSAAGAKCIDLLRVKAELLEDFFVVFADLGRSRRRHFRDTVNLQRTA